MSLSIFRNGKPPAVLVASPVFFHTPVDDLEQRSIIEFEVLRDDAGTLDALIGKDEYYVLSPSVHYFARLTSLEPCTSTHPGLASMRDRAALRGTLKIFMGVRPA